MYLLQLTPNVSARACTSLSIPVGIWAVTEVIFSALPLRFEGLPLRALGFFMGCSRLCAILGGGLLGFVAS